MIKAFLIWSLTITANGPPDNYCSPVYALEDHLAHYTSAVALYNRNKDTMGLRAVPKRDENDTAEEQKYIFRPQWSRPTIIFSTSEHYAEILAACQASPFPLE